MVSGSGLEGLHAIATFYDELCPVGEGVVQNVGSGIVPITHDDIMEGIQRATLTAMVTMEGSLECRELEVMEQLCNDDGDIPSQIKIATFHAFCHHTTILQAVTPDCSEATIERSIIKANQLELEGDYSKAGFLMKHIRSILWLIGLKEDMKKYYVEAADWLKGTLFDTNGQLTGLRRGLSFHLRYALGNCLYQIAMYNCHGDPQMQRTLLNMALPELASCGREIAQENNEIAADHQDASWALTTFGKVAKVIIKLQQGTSTMRDVWEVYNEAAMYARKIGRGDLEELLSCLCSGLRELEGHKWKLGRHTEELDEESEELDEESEGLDEEPMGHKSAAAGFKIFVEVLRLGVKQVANKSDELLESFDLLSHACWWTKESMHSLPFEHLMLRFTMPPLENYVDAMLGICILLLGIALTYILGEEKEGLYYLESAHKRFESDVELSVSLHDMQKALAFAYAEGHATSDHRKAAEMFESAAKTTHNLQMQLKMDMGAATEWVKVPEERVKGMDKIRAVVQKALQVLTCEWELQASLFFDAGFSYLGAGDKEEAIEYMEAGANLCVANDFAFTSQENGGHAREIVTGLSQLLILYSWKENLAAALALHKTVNLVLMNLKCITDEDKFWKDTAWRNWQQALEVLRKATGTCYNVNVKEVESSTRYSWDISELMLNEDIGGGYLYLFAIAEHFQNLADTAAKQCHWAKAVHNLDIFEKTFRQRGILSKRVRSCFM